MNIQFIDKMIMVISAISLGAATYWIQWANELQFARKHAMMRDYIIRHPERFPEPGTVLLIFLL